MFITGITAMFGLVLIIIAAIVFFSQPGEVSQGVVFNKPKVTIDFGVFSSEEFKNLDDFKEMENRYYYEARIDDRDITGYITGISQEDAKKKLEDLGYDVQKIEDSKIGRANPFESYVKSETASVATKTTQFSTAGQ